MIYHPHHLWALRTGSPAKARSAVPATRALTEPGFETDWEHAGLRLAVQASAVSGDVARIGAESVSCGPRQALEVVLGRGLHLHAAMLEDGMRRAGLVLGQCVLVLADWDGDDQGEYVFGDRLMELGRVEYRRALRDLEQAVRDGWPGWSARGVQLLEIPEGT